MNYYMSFINEMPIFIFQVIERRQKEGEDRKSEKREYLHWDPSSSLLTWNRYLIKACEDPLKKIYEWPFVTLVFTKCQPKFPVCMS